MNKRIKNWLVSLFVTLPLSFVLIFFGFLPPRFDAVIYTDNIVGEGTCSSYLTDSNTSFAYLYEGNAYFGSELKTLRLRDLPYNVTSAGLFLFDIDEADFVSYDISMFGRTVSHVSSSPMTHPFTRTVTTAVNSDEEPIVHLVRAEGEDSISISFPGSSLVPAYVWVVYGLFILLIAALLALVVAILFERVPGLRLSFVGAAAVMTTMIMGCFLCGSLPYVDYTYFLLNWLVLFGAALLLNSLTLPWLGTVLVSLFTLLWYIANHFVILFRSKPVMPADLKALGTAKEVAGGYDLTPNWQIIVSAVIVLAFLAVLIGLWIKTKTAPKKSLKKRMLLRGAGAWAAVGMMFFSVNNPAFSQMNDFQWDAKVLEGFHREGIALTFIKSALSGRVQRPEGYSTETVDAYLADYQTEAAKDAVHPTRIIMVMNEAFSDLRTVGLDPNIDVMPFIDSLDENTVEGSLYVSVLGGGTCNTEFEALTGNTLAFLGPGAYPYTENVTAPMFSLASFFRNKGYVAESFHAADATNWNRNMVYPYLGFEDFHSYEDYPNITEDSIVHNYVSDATDYSYIEQRDSEIGKQPHFLFNVTIQNHSPYQRFENVKEAEALVPYEDSLDQYARVYLSLIKLSDDSVKGLVNQYKDSDEPTMIIFFGDHQPKLSDEAQSEIYTQMQGYLDYFKSKFFIWTNYETETIHDVALSANYLPWLILERGNFPLPPYVQMLKEVHEKYPIISSQGVVDSDGYVYDNVAVLLDDPLIRKYQYIQYANLFDEIDPAWFSVK